MGQRVSGSIPNRGTYPGCGPDPQSGCAWKATDVCFSVSLMSLSLKNNNKKKTQNQKHTHNNKNKLGLTLQFHVNRDNRQGKPVGPKQNAPDPRLWTDRGHGRSWARPAAPPRPRLSGRRALPHPTLGIAPGGTPTCKPQPRWEGAGETPSVLGLLFRPLSV